MHISTSVYYANVVYVCVAYYSPPLQYTSIQTVKTLPESLL